ncbi:hypothetical protein G9A89_011916 [Geosiphon pyriformis]|nr:hypothetical protein G9A89_011916 [Geosiphon pyriformis]
MEYVETAPSLTENPWASIFSTTTSTSNASLLNPLPTELQNIMLESMSNFDTYIIDELEQTSVWNGGALRRHTNYRSHATSTPYTCSGPSSDTKRLFIQDSGTKNSLRANWKKVLSPPFLRKFYHQIQNAFDFTPSHKNTVPELGNNLQVSGSREFFSTFENSSNAKQLQNVMLSSAQNLEYEQSSWNDSVVGAQRHKRRHVRMDSPYSRPTSSTQINRAREWKHQLLFPFKRAFHEVSHWLSDIASEFVNFLIFGNSAEDPFILAKDFSSQLILSIDQGYRKVCVASTIRKGRYN